MAVTRAGANDYEGTVPSPDAPPRDESAGSAGQTSENGTGLLWIGTPVASLTGLLVVTGHHDAASFAAGGAGEWALPLGRQLSVRIYESART